MALDVAALQAIAEGDPAQQAAGEDTGGAASLDLTAAEAEALATFVDAFPVGKRVIVSEAILDAMVTQNAIRGETRAAIMALPARKRATALAKALRGHFVAAEGGSGRWLWLSQFTFSAKAVEKRPDLGSAVGVYVAKAIPESAGVHVKAGGKYNSDGSEATPEQVAAARAADK